MTEKIKVLAVQDMIFYRKGQGYVTYDVLINWFAELSKKVDLTITARVVEPQSVSSLNPGQDSEIGVKTRLEDVKLVKRLHPVAQSIKVVSLPDFVSMKSLAVNPVLMYRLLNQIKEIVHGYDVIITNFFTPSAVMTWFVADKETPIAAMFRGNMLSSVKYRYYGLDRILATLSIMGIEGMAGLAGRMRSLWMFSIGMDGVRVANKLGIKVIERYDTNITLQDIEESRGFTRRYDLRGPINMISVTRFEQEKGTDLLITAARILKDKGLDFHLKIIGRGGLRQQLLNLIQGLDLNEQVELVDFLPRKQLFEEYKKADMLVNASHIEGVPIIFFESGLWGMPIVATDVGGIADAYPHMERAWIVPRGNPWALASAMYRLALDADLRKKLGEAAREFSWQHPMEKDIEEQVKRFKQWTGRSET